MQNLDTHFPKILLICKHLLGLRLELSTSHRDTTAALASVVKTSNTSRYL